MEEIKIRQNKLKLFLSLLFVSGILCLGIFVIDKMHESDASVSILVVAVLALICMAMVVKLFDQRPDAVINSDGVKVMVLFKYISAGWKDVEQFDLVQSGKNWYIVVIVNNQDEIVAGRRGIAKVLLRVNAGVLRSPLVIGRSFKKQVEAQVMLDTLSKQMAHHKDHISSRSA